MFKQVETTLRPHSIAIIGAFQRNAWSEMIYRGTRQMGYEGRIALIDPNRDQAFGERCYRSFETALCLIT